MPLVHPLPDPGLVEVGRRPAYASFGGRELAMDLYRPAGLDPGRLALAGFSAGVPLTAAALAAGRAAGVRCAALCYGPPGDLESRPELPPLLVVWAGRDAPDLDAGIDRFVAAATGRGLPVELVEVADGHHAFDLLDDTDASRAAIARVVGFLREHLVA
jgi:dienelactone hydrolase